MNRIEQIARHAPVQAALASFDARQEKAIDLVIAVQQIPAPTFHEAERAAFVEARFRELGLLDVHQDGLHNVYGRLSGTAGKGAPLVLSAHSDTVFDAETDLTVRRNGRYIYGPGIGDNAAGVAGLLLLARALKEFDLRVKSDVWFVANVGEEGLGDLRGMRAVAKKFGKEATYIVIEGGLHGQISHQAIAVQRFRIEAETAGGHSWGSFGEPSAVHELARLVAAIDEISVPDSPKTTYNVGVIQGGTSINTIAQSACMLLDLRSEEEGELGRLVKQVRDLVKRARRRHKRERRGVTIHMTQVGHRPAGRIPRTASIVRWAEQALRYIDCAQITYIAGSTDANIPLSQGVAAVCVGLTVSGNAHRLDEYIDPSYLPGGLQQLLLLTLAAADFQPDEYLE